MRRQPDQDTTSGRPADPGLLVSDHLTHLSDPGVVAADKVWGVHVRRCPQCRAASGPPPPDVILALRAIYACPVGIKLHERAVVAAQHAYEATFGG